MGSGLSNTLVTRLAPAERPYEIRDARLKGLLLRVQPSGVKSYYVEYARGQRICLGRADALTPAQARDQAKEILGEAYRGGDPAAERRRARAHTLGSFVEEVYAPWAHQNLQSAEPTVRRLRASFRDLQGRKLDEITTWLIEKWRTARLKAGTKPSTVNRDLNDLRAALNRAVRWSMLTESPMVGISRCRVDSAPRVRFLEDDEERRLHSALDDREQRLRRQRASANAWRAERGYSLLPDLDGARFADHLKPLVLLALNTGLRRGELFGLTWPDVDLLRANLTVGAAQAKSGRTRHVPLNEEALRVLKTWHGQAGDLQGLVFPGRHGKRLDNVRKAWLAVVQDADIEGFRWHDMRHDFASKLVMAGVDLNTVRELLGHADYAMTLRYAHLAPEHKAAAVAKLAQG